MTRAPARISDVLPLSPLQAGLFFHATAGYADVYRYQLALRVEGPLDVALLRRCAELLLERHAALRTAFLAEETDEPVGVVLDGLALPWRDLDLSGLAGAEQDADQDAELRALAVGERARPFPLDQPPLLRMVLVRLGEQRFHLLLTNHHIVLDGWSVPVLLRELFTLYASGGSRNALPAARPYRDYLAWLAARDPAAARAAWRDTLAGLAGPTLVADPGASADLPVRLPVPVDAELSARLVALARERGVTLNTVLQVLWGLVLGAATGSSDVVFGTTVTGRPPELAGVDSMVGLFINTVPVRVRHFPSDTVGGLLDRVQVEQAALLDAHHLSLAELQRETGFAPMFDTLVVFENYPGGGLAELTERTGLTVVPQSAQDATHYPLVLVAAPGAGAATLSLKYQPGALARDQVERFAARLVEVARRLTEDPDRALAALPTLTVDERDALRGWNETEAPITDDTLVELFDRAAAATPDATALSWAGGALTYRELDGHANRIAHRLREHGVGAEARVGLQLSRSPELVVAMLAVLKAGGAFVPLDPEWPEIRVRSVAGDAGVVAVCTAGPLAGDQRVLAGPSVTVDLTEPGVAAAPRRWVDGEQVAYVIYTSGSTGAPKGAMIRHRSIANRMVWQAGLLGFGPGDVALFKAPLGFDISINEIWLPLTTGAVLAIAAPGEERDVEALVGLMARERVSFCYLVSSMLAAMLELPGLAAATGSLRHLWCGGELLTPELFARFRATMGATMYHGYGPAEATVGVTHEIYRGGSGRAAATIGRPNPNTQVYVLDELLRPVPPGVVGELYLGGLLLGRGYVGDPARTAERFVASPFGAPGSRLYRTGDLAGWLPDGRLRFAGRSDNQVKIRGMRVEPEEIESVLAAHLGVAQAVVLSPADANGTARLVGFYARREAATGRAGPTPEDLRRWLRERLAEHMVPAELVELPALPTQPSGKVDRAALVGSVPAARASAEPARNPTESRLLEAFRAVLGREDFGVTDDFFSFGGHSALATRLVVTLRAALERPLEVRTLLEHPTVAELAARLDSGAATTAPRLADDVLLRLRARGAGAPLFCVHPVSGLALAYAGLLGHLPERPVYGVQARSLASTADLPGDLAEMAAHYVARVREVQPSGPYHLLGWSLGGTVAHLMAGQLAAAGERVETLALLDSVPAEYLGAGSVGDGIAEGWSLERGLAQLLAVSGYPVTASELEPAEALALVTGRDGALAGFSADDLCNVALSWRHSAGLRGGTAPVHSGDLLLFEATREPRPVPLAELWRPLVSGAVRVHQVAATHWEMADPGPLAEVAARLR